MELRKALQNFAKVAADEAERNPEFEQRIRKALGLSEAVVASSGQVAIEPGKQGVRRRGGRRTPAVLNPVELVSEGEQALRDQLVPLTVEQLKDTVAGYGMDPSKLVMKWKSRDRITDHIVQMAITRSQKGDVFRYG
jgi:hypothetical protein